MSRIFCACSALLAAMMTMASAQDIGGSYRVVGKNFDGSTYRGTVQIAVTSENTCRIRWTIGSSVWRGICMRNRNAFSASYSNGNVIGLVIYEIKEDGRMVGLWTLADRDGVGQEVLEPM